MSSDDEPLRDQGWRLRAECADEERKLWAHLSAKRFAGFQIQPAAPHWSILRRFLLRRAPPDYRTRRQSTCRAGGAHGCLENGWSHRAGLSSDAILECRSEHRDRRCTRSYLCSAAGFLNRAPSAALTKDPLWGAGLRSPLSAVVVPVRGRVLKRGASQEARAATTGSDACPTIFRVLAPCGFPLGHFIDTL